MFKSKIRVEVLSPSGLPMYKKNCVVKGNEIIIKKGSKGRGHATVSACFTDKCKIPYYVGLWPFKRLKMKLLLIEGSKECCEVTKKELQLGRLDLEKFFDASMLKNAGSTVQTIKAPTILYIILIMVLVAQGIQILVSSGRLYI